MSYVNVNAPLPQNSAYPPDPKTVACENAVYQGVSQSIMSGLASSKMAASPESFSNLGQGVVNDVKKGQAQMGLTINTPPTKTQRSTPDALWNAPQAVPLNIAGADTCIGRMLGTLQPIRTNPQNISISMPDPAPTDTGLLIQDMSQSDGRFGPMYPALKPSRYYGLSGVPWGDAIGYPIPPRPSMGSGASLLLLALGGLALFAVSQKGKR